MSFPRARLKRFNELSDNIPGVGSYNVVGEQHGNIKDFDPNLTRSLNRLDQSGKVNRGFKFSCDEEVLLLKLKEAQEKANSLEILLNSSTKQKEVLEKEYKILEQKLNFYNQNLKELEKEKTKQSQIIKDLQKENKDLEKKRESSQQECQKITVQLEEHKGVIKSVHKECASLQCEIDKLQNAILALDEEKASLLALIGELKSIKTNLERERKDLSSQLELQREQSLQECSVLKASVMQLQQESEEFNVEKKKLSQTIEHLISVKISLEKDKDAVSVMLEEEKEKNQKECNVLKVSLAELKNESEKLESEKIILHQAVEELRNIKVKLEKDKDDITLLLNEEKIKSTEKCNLLKSSMSELEIRGLDLITKNEALNRTISNLLDKNLDLENRRADSEQAYSTLSNQLEEEKKITVSLRKECLFLQSTILKLQNDIVQLEEEKMRLTEILAESEKEKDAISLLLDWQKVETEKTFLLLKEVNSNSEKQSVELKNINHKLQETIAELEIHGASLEKEKENILCQFVEEREKWQRECCSLTSSISDLKAQHQLIELEKTSLAHTLNEFQQKSLDLEDQLLKLQELTTTQIEEEKRRSQNDCSLLQSANSKLKDRIRELEEEQIELVENLKQTNTDLEKEKYFFIKEKDSLHLLFEESQKNLFRTQEEMSKLQNEFQKENENLKTSLRVLEKLSELQQIKLKEDLDSLQHELLKKTEDNDKISHSLKTLETSMAGKDHQLAEYKLELTALMQKKDELDDYNLQVQTLQQDNKQIYEQLKKVEIEKQELKKQQEEIMAHMSGQSEDWKLKFEELERKIEPFKEALDMFELEKKLLLDRDKYTNEQMEKLTREAIKNMGHQNHRQKVKYVDNLKKENLTLHKKFQETQEELQRQMALAKKYKEKLDKLEDPKKLVTPCKPKIPLKEGNRL